MYFIHDFLWPIAFTIKYVCVPSFALFWKYSNFYLCRWSNSRIFRNSYCYWNLFHFYQKRVWVDRSVFFSFFLFNVRILIRLGREWEGAIKRGLLLPGNLCCLLVLPEFIGNDEWRKTKLVNLVNLTWKLLSPESSFIIIFFMFWD